MLYEWMRAYGKDYGWTEVDPTIAQNRANNGFPTVTVHRNNSDGSSGHVQVVRPENENYVYSSANKCVIAQAGASNFSYGNVRTAYSGGVPTTSTHTYALKYYTHDIADPAIASGPSVVTNALNVQPQSELLTIDAGDTGM
jgi:hypothetical protein